GPARRARVRRVARQLLRARDHEAARARGRRRRAGRARALQHARRGRSAPRGAGPARIAVAGKDYSGTPLSKKLGAGPGAVVTVLFTTSREELAARFPELVATLEPADGLWVAWPKKASAVESDLSFDAVQA